MKKWGGKPEDYQAIHDFLDSSKMCFPDMRHRAILHSSFGIYVAERVFGITLTNSDGKVVSVRDVAEQHVIDDMGRIPTVGDYLDGMPMYEWLGGKPKVKREVDMTTDEPAMSPEMAKRLADEGSALRKAIEERTRRMTSRPFTPPGTLIVD